MTPQEAMAAIREAFRCAPRPELFIRGTCSCDECMEHNETMASHTSEDITIHELGNAGWDPICFASDQAFVYYLPAMFRLAFEPSDYLEQLLFHLDSPGRLDALSDEQAGAVFKALWVLVEQRGYEIAGSYVECQLESVLERLEEKLNRL